MSATTKSPYQIIVRPIVTEKSVDGGSRNQYTFVVARTANKYEIAEAIQQIQADSKNVINVVAVNTMVVKGKTRQGRFFKRANRGKTSDWKKAIVTLQAGQSIELVEGFNTMGIKRYKPTTPSQRFRTASDYSELTASKPEKSLLRPNKHSGGRNNKGRRTAVNVAGGNKTMYRLIDFKRDKNGVPGKVATIEYDPNRSARIALVFYADGEKRYILWPVGLKVGDAIISSETADIKPGNALPLRAIPVGTLVHNIEMMPGKGGQITRTAGGASQLMGKEGKYVTIRLASGEMRMILAECRATVGQIGNIEHENIKHGKAGKKRWLGVYMHTRGVVMSPRDHPHGGGEAKSPVGRKKGPVSATGVRALGFRTRRNKNTQKFIVRRRGSK